MNLGRRFFSGRALFAAAASPAMAKEALGRISVNKCGPPPMPDYPRDISTREAVVSPLELMKRAKRDQYSKAINAFNNVHHNTRHRRNHFHNLNMNIEALHSVSPQHKAIMQENMIMKMEQERKSWRELLLERFGLTKDDVYDNEPQAAGQY